MAHVMSYMDPLLWLQLQAVSKVFHDKVIGRVQLRIKLPPTYTYFTQRISDARDSTTLNEKVLAYSKNDGVKLLICSSSEIFQNRDWSSCQVGRRTIFQLHKSQGLCRLLQIDWTFSSFKIEKRRRILQDKTSNFCLVNVQERQLYVIGGIFVSNQKAHRYLDTVQRYSLAADKWQLMPNLNVPRRNAGACFQGGSIYVVGGDGKRDICLNSIEKLDLANALRWQLIKLTKGDLSPRSDPVVVA